MAKARRRAPRPLDVVDTHLNDQDDAFLDTDEQKQVIDAFALELARQRRALGAGFGALSALGVGVASRLAVRAAHASFNSRDIGAIDRAWALAPHFYAYTTHEASARRLALVAGADVLALACFASGVYASRATFSFEGRGARRAAFVTVAFAFAASTMWFALTKTFTVSCVLGMYALMLQFAFASCDEAAVTLSRLERSTYEHKKL